MVIIQNHDSALNTQGEITRIVEEKARVRQSMREARCAMGYDDWLARSTVIASKIVELPEFKAASRVCCYLHKEATREAGTGQVINHVLKDAAKELVVPITRVERFDLDLSIVRSRDELVIGAFNVLEPMPSKEELVDVNSCDVLFVPCLAVDAQGNRLGYGKGYYDKLLGRINQDIPVIAVAFDFQVLDRLPVLAHDKPVDAIVTEARYLLCSPCTP